MLSKNSYNPLIIYTGNSKVEQLLCRPRNRVHYDYPYFNRNLRRFQQQNNNSSIQVVRVRGPPTIYKQKQSEIKRECAKIDQLVYRKNQHYIYRRFHSI